MIPFSRMIRSVAIAGAVVLARGVDAQSVAGTTLDESVPPGTNFDKANFRLWFPNGIETLRGIIVLMPGSNGDGRPQAADTIWQAFAAKHKLALVAGQLTDKPHDPMFVEEYIDVAKGSGQAFLDVLQTFATKSNHAELANAPLFLWGMSAGGQFNYEFTAWKPERVAAFVVNKGGIYYSALVPKAARNVPGILFTGGKDLAFRTNTIAGLFAINRRAGALWALVDEPSAGHIVGRSRDVALAFYEDVLALRVVDGGPMKAIDASTGFVGDFETKTFGPVPARAPGVPTAWLPTERVAKAWQALITEKPFARH